jgi:hypothetical protein
MFVQVKHKGWPYVFVVAIATIPKDSELLISYGDGYWEGLRNSMRNKEETAAKLQIAIGILQDVRSDQHMRKPTSRSGVGARPSLGGQASRPPPAAAYTDRAGCRRSEGGAEPRPRQCTDDHNRVEQLERSLQELQVKLAERREELTTKEEECEQLRSSASAREQRSEKIFEELRVKLTAKEEECEQLRSPASAREQRSEKTFEELRVKLTAKEEECEQLRFPASADKQQSGESPQELQVQLAAQKEDCKQLRLSASADKKPSEASTHTEDVTRRQSAERRAEVTRAQTSAEAAPAPKRKSAATTNGNGESHRMFPESHRMFPESHRMFPESHRMFPESHRMFPESHRCGGHKRERFGVAGGASKRPKVTTVPDDRAQSKAWEWQKETAEGVPECQKTDGRRWQCAHPAGGGSKCCEKHNRTAARSISVPDRVDGEEVVECILDHKESDWGWEFLVRWKGYSDKDNTWEPPSSFEDEDGTQNYVLVEYLRQHPELSDK